jgi:heme/copper-type cytochrome/quinol oxidase subunit 2
MNTPSGIAVLTARHGRLRAMLWASLVLIAISFLFEIAELAGIYTIGSDPEADLTAIDMVYFLLGLAMIVVGITTIVFWCMWLHRAAKNLVDSDIEGFEFTPAWAVGWHFIPIANLFKPFAVMRKIWNASVGEMGALDYPSPIVTRWWAAWIISSIAGNISTRIALQAESPDTLYLGIVLGAISSVASFVAIPTALKMLEAITGGQAQRFNV